MCNSIQFDCSICGCSFEVANKIAEKMIDRDPADWVCPSCDKMMDQYSDPTVEEEDWTRIDEESYHEYLMEEKLSSDERIAQMVEDSFPEEIVDEAKRKARVEQRLQGIIDKHLQEEEKMGSAY